MNKLTKLEKSWILYDCANSAYSMAITTALLPIYFGMFKPGEGMDLGYVASVSGLIIAFLSPVLGTVADYKGFKKKFFVFFAIIGMASTVSLALVPYGNWQLLVVFFAISSVGFAAANVFYDSLLVDVTSNKKMDKVSSFGFAFGYIASIIPFGISLAVIYFIGMDKFLGFQIGFVLTALWWFVLSIPIFKNVKQIYGVEPEKKYIRKSFLRIGKTFRNIKSYKVVFVFLLAYFFYIDGVNTIIKMVVPYAQAVLGGDALDMFMLLGILLLIQVIAFPFAILYGNLSKKFGAKKMIIVAIISYIIATLYAYYITSVKEIFILGAIVASAQGGIQALSRSYFAKIIPKDNSSEFFGFYNIFGKFASIVGPLIMSVINDVTGNPRISTLGIIPLFIIGLFIIVTLPSDKPELIQ